METAAAAAAAVLWYSWRKGGPAGVSTYTRNSPENLWENERRDGGDKDVRKDGGRSLFISAPNRKATRVHGCGLVRSMYRSKLSVAVVEKNLSGQCKQWKSAFKARIHLLGLWCTYTSYYLVAPFYYARLPSCEQQLHEREMTRPAPKGLNQSPPPDTIYGRRPARQ